MIPIDLAGWPILGLGPQGKDGEVRAFHNVCRHRGIRLVSEPCRRPLIRCPWHSWTYNLQGELTATPEIGGAGAHDADGIDRSTFGLKEIRVGRWPNLIFVNVDGSAPGFEDYIAPVTALLDGYDLEHLTHAMQVNEGYRGNWKLSKEGGLEHYHLTFAHPQLGGRVFRHAETVHALAAIPEAART